MEAQERENWDRSKAGELGEMQEVQEGKKEWRGQGRTRATQWGHGET